MLLYHFLISISFPISLLLLYNWILHLLLLLLLLLLLDQVLLILNGSLLLLLDLLLLLLHWLLYLRLLNLRLLNLCLLGSSLGLLLRGNKLYFLLNLDLLLGTSLLVSLLLLLEIWLNLLLYIGFWLILLCTCNSSLLCRIFLHTLLLYDLLLLACNSSICLVVNYLLSDLGLYFLISFWSNLFFWLLLLLGSEIYLLS